MAKLLFSFAGKTARDTFGRLRARVPKMRSLCGKRLRRVAAECARDFCHFSFEKWLGMGGGKRTRGGGWSVMNISVCRGGHAVAKRVWQHLIACAEEAGGRAREQTNRGPRMSVGDGERE